MSKEDFHRTLVRRYISNQASKEEVEAYFELLKRGALDKIIAAEMDGEAPDFGAQHVKVPSKPATRTIPWMAVAASLILLIGIGIVFKSQIRDIIDPVQMLAYTTKKGERIEVTLPDGTGVWLGPGTVLKFPEEFRKDERPVTLTGEGYFEVTKDEEKPFSIQSGNVRTVVLGTSFQVKAYEDSPDVSVTLVEGRVTVDNKNGFVELKPNERAVFRKADASLKKEPAPDAQKLLSERDGIFEYDGSTLGQVIADVEREYGITVEIHQNLNKSEYYGTLDRAKPAREFLDKLVLVIGGQLEKISETHYRIAPG